MKTVPAKTIIARTKSSAWFGIDYNMNIYRGCCHGCIYCDSRSACYGITDFDTVRAKENALVLIRDELRSKVHTGVVGTGAMSDPYNPFEKAELLTRHALELLYAYGFGAALATKSPLITRDIDLLQDINAAAPVLCKITITTGDDALAQKIEPQVAPSSERFKAIRALADAGIFTGILLMPVLPFLEDSESNVLDIVARAADAGARFIYPAFGMTLRENQRAYYYEQLERIFPNEGLSARYAQRYGTRYNCTSPRAKQLWKAFCTACNERGLLYKMNDIIAGYKQGKQPQQLSLFDAP